MKIAVMSDTHGKLEITQVAIHLLCERGAELILHCGDIDSTDTVRLFRGVPTQFVFGNWDRSRTRMADAMRNIGAIGHNGPGDLVLASKRIAWLHGHISGERARLESSGDYDFLFYGHSHRAETHRTGRTLV